MGTARMERISASRQAAASTRGSFSASSQRCNSFLCTQAPETPDRVFRRTPNPGPLSPTEARQHAAATWVAEPCKYTFSTGTAGLWPAHKVGVPSLGDEQAHGHHPRVDPAKSRLKSPGCQHKCRLISAISQAIYQGRP